MNTPNFSITDAGRFLGHNGKSYGKTTIYEHIRTGRLTAVRIGRRTFVTRESVERLIADCTVGSP